MKFRKRPEIISAFIWEPAIPTGELPAGSFIGTSQRLCINAKDGMIAANPGDYVIVDDNGGFRAMRPEEFAAAYEAVE